MYVILFSQIAFWLFIIIIGVFLYKQLKETESEEPLPNMEEMLNAVIEVFTKNVSNQIKHEFHSKETQTMLNNTFVNSIASLMVKKENQQMVAEFMMESFATVLEEGLPQIMQATTGIQPTTPADAKKIDEKATAALGAMSVNAASELLPPGAGWVLSKVFPDWEEQAQNNPREFMAMMAKAKEWGLFDMLSGLAPKTLGSTGVTRTARSQKVF